MSSLSIPRPKKVSDGQFIGDLTKLLERRKIKCGDPDSLETFGSELTSNNTLRSDLFTLCTAISHMADEDLSGEQLLVLVARAAGGPEICRGDGAVGVPDSMRSAFLSGYEAWSNRGSELDEPLPWPPPRPQVVRSEPLPAAEDSKAVPDPIAFKAPGSGLHTIQEALDIAKKRSPVGLAPPRSSAPGTNIEGLTISELKLLLADIEHRMSRIQPHLSQLNHIVDSTAGVSKRLERASESEDVIPFRAAAWQNVDQMVQPRELPPSVAASLAVIANPELAAVLPSTPHVSEDAFLARHPYMRPSRRIFPDLPITILPATPIDALPVADTVPAAAPVATPSLVVPVPVAAAPLLVSVAAPLDVSAPAPARAAVATAPPAVSAATPPAAFLAAPTAAANPVPPPLAVAPGVGGAPVIGLNPIGVALVFALDSLCASPRLMAAVAAILLLVPTGFAGAFIYCYLHPPMIIRYPYPPPPAVVQQPELPADPLAGVVPATPGTTPDAASSSQARPIVSGARPMPRPQPPIAHHGTSRGDATRQSRLASQPQPQAFVWPPPPENAGGETPAPARPVVAAATSTLPTYGATRAPHLTGPPASAIYVASSTMIKYAVSAPKPVYPVDRAKGMEGTVVLQITISKQGDVTSTRTVSGPVELRAAAVQAVRMWRFRPYLLSGNLVDVETTMELPFKPQ